MIGYTLRNMFLLYIYPVLIGWGFHLWQGSCLTFCLNLSTRVSVAHIHDFLPSRMSIPREVYSTSTQNGSLILNGFLYWYRCLFCVEVHPRNKLLRQKYHEKLIHIHKCSKCCETVGLGSGVLWLTIHSSSDFCCDWFPRAPKHNTKWLVRETAITLADTICL